MKTNAKKTSHKYLNLTILLSLMTISLFSQITIERKDFPKSEEQFYKLTFSLKDQNIDKSKMGLHGNTNPGGVGVNQIWDFSSINVEQVIGVKKISFFDNSKNPTDIIPEPNNDFNLIEAEYSNGGIGIESNRGVFSFYNFTDTSINYLGYESTLASIGGNTGNQFYNSPQVKYKFPLSYLQKNSFLSREISESNDFGGASATFDPFNRGPKKRISTTITNSIIDAFGTLVLPTSKSVSCLRNEIKTIFIDSTINLSNNNLSVKIDTLIHYEWISADYGIIARYFKNSFDETISFLVNQIPCVVPTINLIESERTACINGSISIMPNMSKSKQIIPFNVFWQYRINSTSNIWNNIIANDSIEILELTNTLILTELKYSMNNYQFRAAYRNNCDTFYSPIQTIKIINENPFLKIETDTLQVCPNNKIAIGTESILVSKGGAIKWSVFDLANKPVELNKRNDPKGLKSRFSPNNDTIIFDSIPSRYNGYKIKCSSNSICDRSKVESNTIVIKVNFNPSVTLNKVSFSSPIGNTASISAAISMPGTISSYKWQKQMNGSSSWIDISISDSLFAGSSTKELRLLKILAEDDSTKFRFVVNTNCGKIITSNTALLTVNFPPKIKESKLNWSVCENDSVNIPIIAISDGIVEYKWQVSIDGGISWTDLINSNNYSNVNTAMLTIKDAMLTMNNSKYRCVVIGANGTTNSQTISIVVKPKKYIVTTPSKYISTCALEDVIIPVNVNVVSDEYIYQWEMSTNNGNSWTNIADNAVYTGANTSKIKISSISALFNHTLFRCKVSTACKNEYSSNIKIFIAGYKPTISNQPEDTNVNEGESAQFQIKTWGILLNYTWEVSNNEGYTWTTIKDTMNYAGATTSTLTLTNISNEINNSVYRCITSNSCGEAISSIARLSIKTPELQQIKKSNEASNENVVLYKTNTQNNSQIIDLVNLNTPSEKILSIENWGGIVNGEDVILYPNPAIDYLNIEYAGKPDLDINKLEVYNMVGEKVFELNNLEVFNKQTIRIDNLPTGTYSVLITTKANNSNENQLIFKKFIKQ